MKKVIVPLIGLSMLLFFFLNYSSISRNIRKLHLFNSATLLKSSSFDAFTIDVFQDNNQIKVEVYSSHRWFTEDDAVYNTPVTLDQSDLSIIWKKINLKSEEQTSRNVIAVSVESSVEEEELQYYRGVFSDTEAESAEDFFNLLEIDISDNPTQVD